MHRQATHIEFLNVETPIQHQIFNYPGKIFQFIPGKRYPDGRRVTHSEWVPKYHGMIKVDFNHIIAVEDFDNHHDFAHEITEKTTILRTPLKWPIHKPK